MTGIDYLQIDAHLYKSREFPSRIAGVGAAGSQRAMDLEMKLGILREPHGDRVATFATAVGPTARPLGRCDASGRPRLDHSTFVR